MDELPEEGYGTLPGVERSSNEQASRAIEGRVLANWAAVHLDEGVTQRARPGVEVPLLGVQAKQ